MALQGQVDNVRDAALRASTFVSEVWSELRKVHWPGRKETYAATVVVLVVTFLVAAFLGVVDLVISRFVQAILS